MEQERARELLTRERARLERALSDLDQSERADEVDPFDPGDVAPDLLDAELGAGLSERLRQELAAIERAESRLELGTFGLSVESGEPIPDARLQAIPWAERTISEQERYDRSGG